VTRVGTSSYDLACRIVDGPEGGGDDVEFSFAEVRLVAFDIGTQRSRPLGEGERSRLVGLLEPSG
jgi:hypothetical protein